ncbi:hypothetical protein [Flavobacterium sp.]|uniref:hypothetical protein n=1 Tax=Flavobacterium sp. TaxID=239 RepID=UPI0031D9D446
MKNEISNLTNNLRSNDEMFITLFENGILRKKLNQFLLDYTFAKQNQDGFIVMLNTDENKNAFISANSEFSLYAIRSISVIENGDFYFHIVLNLKDDYQEKFFLTIYMNYDLSVYDIELSR